MSKTNEDHFIITNDDNFIWYPACSVDLQEKRPQTIGGRVFPTLVMAERVMQSFGLTARGWKIQRISITPVEKVA